MQLKKQTSGTFCENCESVTKGIYLCACGWIKKLRENESSVKEEEEKGERYE